MFNKKRYLRTLDILNLIRFYCCYFYLHVWTVVHVFMLVGTHEDQKTQSPANRTQILIHWAISPTLLFLNIRKPGMVAQDWNPNTQKAGGITMGLRAAWATYWVSRQLGLQSDFLPKKKKSLKKDLLLLFLYPLSPWTEVCIYGRPLLH